MTKRSQLIQRMKSRASTTRGLANSLPLNDTECEYLYEASDALDEGAHHISLDDMSESTRELMLFACALVGVSGAGIGVIATLLLT